MISVVICTYKRADSLKILLENLEHQSLSAGEVLIIDGSPDDETAKMINSLHSSLPLTYFLVPPEHRGLTRQRNFGILKVNPATDVVCFLDDDVVLDDQYLKILQETFTQNPDCVGASGYLTNGRTWEVYDPARHNGLKWFVLDGFALELGQRNYVRRALGLFPDVPPGFIPPYGHGYDVVPPSGKSYEADHIIGCNMSFRYSVFKTLRFSDYFIGYGLYEDCDFSYRTTRFGKLLVNTRLKLEHHLAPSGRPDTFKYGKMVTRNGWFVWRTKYKNPGLFNILKWYTISVLFALLLIKSFRQKAAVHEFAGRVAGLFSVMFNAPKLEN